MHTGADVDLSTLRREFQSVRQQVQEYLLQLPLVGADHSQARVDRALERYAATVRALPDKNQRVFDGGRQIEVGRVQFHAPRLDLGQIKDVVDKREAVPSRLQNVTEVFRLLGVDLTEHPLGQDLREADDGVERRSQLVRHVGKKLALVSARCFELPALVLDLAEKSRILDGQRRLRRESLQQVDHLRREL